MESENQSSAQPSRSQRATTQKEKNQEIKMSIEPTDNRDRESEEQNNQDYCFKCKKRGDIYCCDNCPRSFHAEGGCLPRRPTEAVWRCPCCRLRDQCPVCEVAVQPVDRHFICNICYRRTHNMCTGVPKDLLTTKIDDDLFFMQECLFICYVCLYNSEVKTIVKTVKTSNPGDYKLVSPYYASGVHLGWISDSNLNKISDKPKKLKHSNPVDRLYKRPEIERLLSIQCPLIHRGKSVYEIIDLVRDTKRKTEFGDPNNFKFLVKWKGEDYLNSTWQDEMVVKASQSNALETFIHKKELEMHCLIEKTASFKDFRQAPPHPILTQNEQELLKEMLSMYQINKNIFLPKFNGQKSYQAMIALMMSNLFYQEQTTLPFLIISRFREIQSWTNAINEYCQGMYLVVMTGILQNRNIIKARELFYEEAATTKFDILLTTYDCLSKDIGIFYNRQINVTWSGIIFDEEVKSYVIVDRKPKIKATHKIVIAKQLGPVQAKLASKILCSNKKMPLNSTSEIDRQIIQQYLPKNIEPFAEFPLETTIKKPLIPIKITIKPGISPANRKNEMQIYDEVSEKGVSQSEKPSEKPSEKSSQKLSQKPQSRLQVSSQPNEDEQKSSAQYSLISSKVNSQNLSSAINNMDTIKYLQVVRDYTLTNKEQLPLQKYKRIAFLRFVIAFGLSFPDGKTLLNKLVEFEKGLFENTNQQRKKVERYVLIFLALVNSRKPEQCAQVLFHLNPPAVLRRIADLHNLQILCQQYENNPQAFPIKKRFDFISAPGSQTKDGSWSEVDDLLLFRLIIDYGYDNWQPICQSIKWVPQALRTQNTDPVDFLLKKMCDLPANDRLDQLKACCRLINNRAAFMLQQVRLSMNPSGL